MSSLPKVGDTVTITLGDIIQSYLISSVTPSSILVYSPDNPSALSAILNVNGTYSKIQGDDRNFQIRFPHSIRLELLSAKHFSELLPIVQDPEVMRWVKDGRVWDATKLRNLIQYSEEDTLLEWTQRKYYYWAIMLNNRVIGLIGIHAQNYDRSFRNYLFLTILVGKEWQRKGYASKAVQTAFTLIPKQTIFADVRSDNVASANLLLSVDFTEVGPVDIRRIPYRRFRKVID